MISVIAVFPLKTGNSMFVGFDSQNTSQSFLNYLDWDLWVSEILKYIQRISDNGLCGILKDKYVTVSAVILR